MLRTELTAHDKELHEALQGYKFDYFLEEAESYITNYIGRVCTC
jgi:hypothetical protein